jgi:predicted permease
MLRSFMALRAVDPGFDPDNVLTARVSVPAAEIPEWQAVDQFFRQLQQRLESQPGVTAVGYVNSVPLGGAGMSYASIAVEDQPRADNELPVFSSLPQASAGYFQAMGIRVLEGRAFEPGDGGDRFRAVIVGRAFAQQWWPDRSAIGRRLNFGGEDEAWYEIVGVVDDVRQDGLQEVSQEMVYFPLVTEAAGQTAVARTLDVVIRTSGDPLALVPVLRGAIHDLNPRIPIANPRTMTEVFKGATARTSFTMAMLGAASGIALLLGLVGIYGVISYIVSQRTREIGVRMALGASGAVVRGMVVKQGLILSGVGVGLGLLASALLSRVMSSLLFGVSATDPVTYIAVAASLVTVAMLASLIPAVRAAAVDPSRALRTE